MLKKYFTKGRQQTSSLDSANKSQCEQNDKHNKNRKRHSSNSFSDELSQNSLANEFDLVDGSANSLPINDNEDIFHYRSHLSMSLSHIIAEPICLSYFVQYLEDNNALALIKFYLDIENFKTVAIAQTQQTENVKLNRKNSHNNEQQQFELEDKEEEDHVPEFRILYDLSMRKPLTDDEKSQIYADVSKQITKSCGSQLSLCSTRTDTDEAICACAHASSACLNAASEADAMTIYQKYLNANAKYFIKLPINILSQISLLLCKHDATTTTNDVANDERLIRVNCFDEAQQWVLQQLEYNYLYEFLQSKYYCKYCVELIEDVGDSARHQLNICDILYSEATLFFFMEFLEQHEERECLDFWTQAINFRKSYCQAAEQITSDIQTDAMIIYDRYFSLQADCSLWMSDKLRLHIEEQICGEQVAYCYDLPLRLTAQYLQRKYLQSFLKSPLFLNYVTELKDKLCKTQNHVDDSSPTNNLHTCTQQKHRKTPSDGNISVHNTLLAMDTSYLKNLHATANEANMNIDARQLLEPQLLWRRRSSSSLKFGSINALGRYERDFESVNVATNAHKNWSLSSSGNKFKNVMRKFINLPEDNLQEEIAWQVAEMIVKDVTNITLNQSTNTKANEEKYIEQKMSQNY